MLPSVSAPSTLGARLRMLPGSQGSCHCLRLRCRPRVEHLEDRIVPAGEPILVVTAPANPFSTYYAEILRAEGLNEFATSDIAAVSPATLADHDVVILGEMPLTASQVTMFSDWVTAGGNLIAMRPDKQLAGLLGLTDAASTRANAYLLVNTASGPGTGIVNETIQYHGTADVYTLNGASSIATLYATATTATSNPAVTLRSVGASGGQAAAFTYDLARSIVYTRQGNPAWSGQERDGIGPIRSNDLFYGNASFDPQPDWIDLNKVAIPQADEQQRLLANLITEMNLDNLPLPRFWYLPRGEKAAVIMTGDDHGNGGTAGRFNQYIAASPAGSSADDWSAIRGTSYIYPNTPLTNAQAAAYAAQGFEIALHVNTNSANWTPAQLDAFYANQLAQFQRGLPQPPGPGLQPHPRPRLERLRHPAEGRVAARHPPRHQLLLLRAGRLDSEPSRHVHRLRHADALRGRERHPDRRLPGRHPDDRRVGPDLPVHGQRAARRGPGHAGLLRRLHRQHAHRRRHVARLRRHHRLGPGPQRARRLGAADAHLARRPQQFVVQLAAAGTRRRARSASPSRPARVPTGWRRWCRCARPRAC